MRIRMDGSRARRAGMAALAVAGLAGTARAQVVFNDHTYLFTPTAGTWTQAEAAAIGLGGHLVAVNDAAEQAFLEATFLQAGALARPVWIGLNDAADEGTFVWSNGDPVTYTNWQTDEPNNFQGVEDYAALHWFYSFFNGTDAASFGRWNDLPLAGSPGTGQADGPYFGIVEINIAPEPGSMALLLAPGALLLRGRRRRVARP